MRRKFDFFENIKEWAENTRFTLVDLLKWKTKKDIRHTVWFLWQPWKDDEFFKPVGWIRDIFWNRMFNTNSYSFYDSSWALRKAGILISSEWVDFVKKNRWILRIIEKWIYAIWESNPDNPYKKIHHLDLWDWIMFDRLWEWWQSVALLLTIWNEKYVIKKYSMLNPLGDAKQKSYRNEMMQTQELKNSIWDLPVELQEFMFASSNISCTRYVEWRVSKVEDLDNVQWFKEWFEKIRKYVDKKRSQWWLWKWIHCDFENSQWLRLDDFLIWKDWKCYFIDPFMYDPNE